MRVIKAEDIAKAHEKAVNVVFSQNESVITEDGELCLQGLPLTLVIDKPLTGQRISEYSDYNIGFMEQYTMHVLDGSDDIFEYDYHERLFDYKGSDQIEHMVDKLVKNPTSRRAVAITWQPSVDNFAKDVPCLQLITGRLSVRDDIMYFDMEVVFRSNDVLMALGANMYALAHLQKSIAGRIGVRPGRYTHIMLCPHIYFKRDESSLKKFIGA